MNLDWPLPAGLAIGAGTALFVGGTCFDPEAEIVSLSFVLDGQEQPVWAHGMPRREYFRLLHPGLDVDALATGADLASTEDPALHSYRSGFWGVVRVAPLARPPRSLELALRATLANGQRRTAPVATLALTDGADPAPPPSSAKVAICLATYNPPLELFRRQVDSIRAQTYDDWICLISDDFSRPGRYEEISEIVGDDPRFIISRSSRRQGFYLNFERALRMVPPGVQYVALADQDDFWYAEKLETLISHLGDAQLVYSDARIVGRDGTEIAPTFWARRRRNHEDLLSLLVANCVTGAASLFRRELLDAALPFPPAQFANYHDHWIALTARMRGRIEFIDRPLYDYVQHAEAMLGHSAATRVFTLRQRAANLSANSRERVRFYRSRYFRDVARLMVFATILEMRCGAGAARGDRRVLENFLSLDRSWAGLGSLSVRAARELSGTPETLGAEWALLRALLWRHMLARAARRSPTGRLRLDATPPPDLAPRAERRPLGESSVRSLAQKVQPLEFAVSQAAPRRVNVLIPTIDLEHFFGGYIAKLNLADALARRGARVRVIATDPVPPLPRDWRHTIEAYAGLGGLFDRVEVEFGRHSASVEASPDDTFVATTWWTAHIAQAACQTLGREGFVYLVQEYEPMTFPWGAMSSLAEQSYRFQHFALFSSELLREYFRRHRIGVYASGSDRADGASASFQNAITKVAAPSQSQMSARQPRRLLFYARPEPHAARNMFELGVLALGRALEEGAFRRGWEVRGIGAVADGRRIDLGGDVELELVPRVAQREYASMLADHDIGLALMYSPHPSLVPIEMASAGLVTVTNTFENKTEAALQEISGNLIAREPTIEGVSGALQEAAAHAEDFDRRSREAAVRWSDSWTDSFDDRLLERLEEYLAFPSRAA